MAEGRRVSGFAMTLLFVVLSILPIIQVDNRLLFAMKISSVILLANGVGLAIFLGKRARVVARAEGRRHGARRQMLEEIARDQLVDVRRRARALRRSRACGSDRPSDRTACPARSAD